MLAIASCSSQGPVEEQIRVKPESSLLVHLQYLSSDKLEGRKVGSRGGILAQEYLVEQLSLANIQPLGKHYLTPFLIEGMFSSTQGNNVVGLVPGTEYSDKFIVLSAHFDHIGGKGKRVYNGADDNASGTAALLHYAKLLKQSPLRYSVILLFTDGEEANLKGANAFIQQNNHLLNNILLNINIDMIAGNKGTRRLRYINHGLGTLLNHEQLAAYVEQQQRAPVKLKRGFRQLGQHSDNKIKWQVASDHGAFYRHDIPFIYFGVGTHSNYHQTSDTYENANHQFFIKAVDTIYQQITFLDRNL